MTTADLAPATQIAAALGVSIRTVERWYTADPTLVSPIRPAGRLHLDLDRLAERLGVKRAALDKQLTAHAGTVSTVVDRLADPASVGAVLASIG